MNAVLRSLLAALFLCCIAGCKRQNNNGHSAVAPDAAKDNNMLASVEFIDDYLAKWDQFAKGNRDLTPFLRDNKPKFEASLAQMLRAGDRGAVARLVFYPIVQVGGAIPADSELGMAALEIPGSNFPVKATKEGRRILFCADLYDWWEKHQKEYPHFKIFDDWISSDFAQSTVLPMYKGLQDKRRQ